MERLSLLLNKIKNYLLIFFTSGHTRSIQAKKNIAGSFIVKGFSIIINLALVPLTINYVRPDNYGVWLTLSSIVGWFTFIDLGFGHGLRNRFAEAIAKEDFEKARIFVSTTYAIFALVFTIIWVLFIVLNYFINWSWILNTKPEMNAELSLLAIIVFSFFCLQNIFKIINIIIVADQKPAKAAFLDLLGQILSLIFILILVKVTKGSLIYLGFVLGISPIIVAVGSTLYFFNKEYEPFKPSFRNINFSYAKDILTIGAKFFLIQIAVIVIYQTNNLIIAQIGSPQDVTIYNIAYKYMSIALMIFLIIITPFWTAFTDAYTKKDYEWMIKTMQKLRRISLLIIPGVGLLLLTSDFFYKIWIGDSVVISFGISGVTGIFIILLSWVGLNTQMLNGIGKVKVQLYAYSIGTFLHIPVAILLGQLWGTIGVIISASIFCSIIAYFSIKQLSLLMQRKATGIWNE